MELISAKSPGFVLTALGNALNRGLKLPVVEGLEQIVHCPELERGLGVGEVAVGREQDDADAAALLTQAAEHFEPVHARHAYVGDDDIGPQSAYLLQPGLAVGGLAHDLAVYGGPVHGHDYAAAHQFLVLYDDDLQHSLSSFLAAGRLIITQVPRPSAGRKRRPCSGP